MPGNDKQKNKSHKAGRKAGLSRRHKFKESAEVRRKPGFKALGSQDLRGDRLNKAKQARDAARRNILDEKRSAREHGPPKVVGLLALSDSVDLSITVRWLSEACNDGTEGSGGMDTDDSLTSKLASGAPLTMLSMKHKVRFTLLAPARADLAANLEMCKVADMIVLTAHPGDALDPTACKTLTTLRNQGLPPSCLLLQGVGTTSTMAQRSAAKKQANALLDTYVEDVKVLMAESSAACGEVLRHIAGAKGHAPNWRVMRPYLLAEHAEFVPSPSGVQQAPGSLLLQGYVRGAPLSADQLVHLPGIGDFQISQIDGPEEPCPFRGPRQRPTAAEGTDMAMEEGVEGSGRVLATPSEFQEELIRENEVNPLDAEQTWPTEEEMMEAEKSRKRGKRVPKGTSEYQSAWILDESDNEEGDDDEDDEEEEMGGAGAMEAALDDEELEMDEEDEDEEEEEYTEEVENAAQMRAAAEAELEARRRDRAEAEELEFPDEVETPFETPARQRFARFRGLKSFRTSPWDNKESLPPEYGRIFAFSSFKRAMKNAKTHAAELQMSLQSLPIGTYVRVQVKEVPPQAAQKLLTGAGVTGRALGATPLIMCGLLEHESKLTVLHVSAQKAQSFTDPVKSKDELVFHVGFRQFTSRPLFSTDALNADKHKFERFLHHGAPSVASFYAPITFPNAPVLAFQSVQGGGQGDLVFTGSLRGADPDRIVLKRIILTGIPYKVHKRKVTVQYMFYRPEDVRWFRPVECWTKYGRRGRIKEPVGTHGRMKCLFDGAVQQRDTVCISLYKRVFPPFPKEDILGEPSMQ